MFHLKIKFILMGVISLGILVGMVAQVMILLNENQSYPATFLIIGIVSFIGFIWMIMKSLYLDVKQGLPSEDERSKKIKMYSAGRAYFFSLFIWIALLAFHKHLESDDILILGLFGMVLTLLISWLITKNKKGLE